MAGIGGTTAVTRAASLAVVHSLAVPSPAAVSLPATAALSLRGVEINHGITAILLLIALGSKQVVT